MSTRRPQAQLPPTALVALAHSQNGGRVPIALLRHRRIAFIATLGGTVCAFEGVGSKPLVAVMNVANRMAIDCVMNKSVADRLNITDKKRNYVHVAGA